MNYVVHPDDNVSLVHIGERVFHKASNRVLVFQDQSDDEIVDSDVICAPLPGFESRCKHNSSPSHRKGVKHRPTIPQQTTLGGDRTATASHMNPRNPHGKLMRQLTLPAVDTGARGGQTRACLEEETCEATDARTIRCGP